MIGLKNSYEIAYNGTENECRFELYADTAADLQGVTHFDGIKIQMGSECTVIATGDKYLLNGSGAWILQPSDRAFSNVYTKPEIDTMIHAIYQTIMYYHTEQESADGSITFYTLGGNVGSLTIYGNGQQTGTPTPDNPIMPEFVGTLSDADWTIPITCAGHTVPVYLGQVQTVRRVRKLVLDGTENWSYSTTSQVHWIANMPNDYNNTTYGIVTTLCTHYRCIENNTGFTGMINGDLRLYARVNAPVAHELYIKDDAHTSSDDFKAFLAQQYANGTPVTVWYILATSETGIINEPLAKIGDYSDELNSTDAGVTIPTARGQNTLTVDTTLPPSKIVISGE